MSLSGEVKLTCIVCPGSAPREEQDVLLSCGLSLSVAFLHVGIFRATAWCQVSDAVSKKKKEREREKVKI